MEASELRIGNLINVERFGINVPVIIERGSEIDNCEIDKYKPIPLTEEWLLNFGFDNKEGTRYYHNNFNRLYCDVSNRIMKYFGNANGLLKETEYVHQIQNLYFALTGEELTLKTE